MGKIKMLIIIIMIISNIYTGLLVKNKNLLSQGPDLLKEKG